MDLEVLEKVGKSIFKQLFFNKNQINYIILQFTINTTSMQNRLFFNNSKILWVILLGCCSFIPRAYTQTWTHYFGSTEVRAVRLDSSGNYWFGTQTGLWKFDGTRYTHYHRYNSGLGSNSIYDIAINNQGLIWIASGDGISRFDGTNWTNYDSSNSPLWSGGSQIAIDAQGDVWVGTTHGLFEFDGTNWTKHLTQQISTFAIDAQNKVWASALNTLFQYNGTNWIQSPVSMNGIAATITAIAFDRQNLKWFGTDQGISKFDGVNWTHYSYLLGTPKSITIDANNHKWFGSTSGLVLFNDTTWSVKLYGQINSLGTDRQNFKVIGGAYGAFKYNGNRTLTPYDLTNTNLVSSDLSAMKLDLQNKLWIGNYFGLAMFDGTTWTRYDTLNSNLRNQSVTAIAVDAQNNKWIGTNRGVSMFDGTNWTRYDTSNGLPHLSVRSIGIDGQNNKWFCAGNLGVTKFDGTNWTHYTSNNDPYFVNNFQKDPQGNIWCTRLGGSPLYKFNGQTWDQFQDPNTNGYYGLAIDRYGNKWTSNNGTLIKFNGTTWQSYPTGVWNLNLVYDIAIDSMDNKWVLFNNNSLGKFDGIRWTFYTPLNSTSFGGNLLQIDAQNHKWIGVQGIGISKLSDTCLAPLQFSLRLWKGDSLKPLIHNTLNNATQLIVTGNPNNSMRFDQQGNYVYSAGYGEEYAIRRKSLAVEGLPELDGMDVFAMNLVRTDHPNATRSVAQLLAMDVNGDNVIDSLDANGLIERSLAAQTGFIQQFSNDTIAWRHFSEDLLKDPALRLSRRFPNNDSIGVSRHQVPWTSSFITPKGYYRSGCDTVQTKVISIFLGDADGSYFDNGSDSKGLLADTTLVFDGLNAIRLGGDTFRVPVYATAKMFGIGFKISNHGGHIQVLSVSNGVETSSFSKSNYLNRQYSMMAYSKNANGIPPNTPICYVTVKTACAIASHFGTVTARLNGKKVSTQVTWNPCNSSESLWLNENIHLYPNPVSDRLTIELPLLPQQLSLANNLGQVVKVLEINGLNKIEVDMSALPKGIYHLRVNHQNVKKVVKL
jgi:ligand-binding sensor domain-containing protein